MSFLFEQFPTSGYPLIMFALVGIVGFILVTIRPLWAFLFCVMGLAGKNFHAAVLTRMPITGEYLNLNDLFLWIAVLALFVSVYRTNRKIQIPKILMAIIVVLLIGSVQSILKYGPEPFVLRSIWSVAIFPIMFLVSVNFIKSESDARLFFWAFFLGALIASLQHMVFLGNAYLAGIPEGGSMRTISYLTNGGFIIIVTSIFMRLPEVSRTKNSIYYTGLILITISALLSQTRQLYIVFFMTVVTMMLILRKSISAKHSITNIIVLLCSVILLFTVVMSNWSIKELVSERLAFVTEREVFDESYLTRALSMKTEIDIWLGSTIILGIGTAYPPEYTEPYREGDKASQFQTGALNHVAITSYLAHHGLVGTVLFLLVLPLITIRYARWMLVRERLAMYSRLIIFMAIAAAFMDMLNPFGSMLNTALTAHTTALVYGGFWGIYRHNNMRKDEEFNGREQTY